MKPVFAIMSSRKIVYYCSSLSMTANHWITGGKIGMRVMVLVKGYC